ncbi:HDIG domain-containing protein [Thermosyntropha lipolytica DSM 11003]|uniref:HDIG domain-containing protein n=1 Tax=Thermosyntropha lipolytica DSM 11003 TaxID=1123382 RepID=A0A1M5Q184_9FIRM|nr:HD domain-containing phosphohydrolase [Thermosyntropha lipolytica]SHH07521.1 HDIG domain-containing protein [Thermosyntropha lipolytica DSM 11003]
MKRGNIFLLGAVLTSLIITLDLVWNLPVGVRTVLFLLAGLALTYYAALSYKLDREKEALEDIIAIAKEIEKLVAHKAFSWPVEEWIKRVIPCGEVVYGLEGENKGRKEVLARLLAGADSEKGMIINHPSELKKLGLKGEVKSLLVLPMKNEEKEGVFCFNSQEGGFSRYDLTLLKLLLDKVTKEKRRMVMQGEREKWLRELVYVMLRALESTTPLFSGHGERVEKIALLLGEKLGLTEEEKEVLSLAALLHDIGRSIPHPEEEGEKDLHAVYGAELFPQDGRLGEIREAIYYHHERYDGSGIPEGLKYDEIPFISRIIAVADVYDAVVYINREDENLNHDLGRAVIKKAQGRLFDPLVVTAMEEVEKEIEAVYSAAR